MTNYYVTAEEVMGSSYQVTNISCDSYNPGIGADVSVTVTVTDVYGSPVTGETVSVTCSNGNFTELNGSSITPDDTADGTTDASGQFTLTYTASVWGLVTFEANNTNVQINVRGWVNVAGSSTGTWEVLRNQDHAKLILRNWTTTASAGTSSWNSFGSSAYAGSCRPTQYRTFLNSGATLYWRINTDGTIEYRSTSGTVASGTSIYMEIEWAIRDADL